jgi:monofunctional chorismate mutase
MQDLSKLRENINEIDNKIIELWKERMELSLSVAEYKRENNLPVLDAQREKELLDRIKNMAGDELGDYSVSLYETIMSLSRSYQQKHLENK